MKRILLMTLAVLISGMIPVIGIDVSHGALQLKQGTIDVDDAAALLRTIPSPYRSMDTLSGRDGYYMVAVTHLLSSDEINASSGEGVRIVRYLPDNGYIVHCSGDRLLDRTIIPALHWAVPLQPWFRLDPRLHAILEQIGQGMYPEETVPLRLSLFPGEDSELVLTIVEQESSVRVIGMTRAATPDESAMLLVAVPSNELAMMLPRLAELPGLEMVLPQPRMVMHNNAGIWVHQSFINGQTPIFNRNLTGHNQIAAVSDSGLDEDECYFHDPVNGYSPLVSTPPFTGIAPDLSKRKVILYMDMGGDGRGDADSAAPAHGTHTAGSVLGDNYATPAGPTSAGHDNGDGMAPAAKLVSQDLGGALEYLNGGGTFAEILESAWVAGARVHSNSWGASCCSFLGCSFFCIGFNPLATCNVYDDFARDADLKMWQHPDLLVLTAAGNDGDCGAQSIGTPGTAKNILTVGANDHDSSAVSSGSFSGKGLCYDNRTKPTVMGQGVNVVSAAGNNVLNPPSCVTRTLSGTSMACPTIAGMTVLVRQYYTDGFYPVGYAVPLAGFTPSGALLKATVIQSSRDMTGVTGNPPNSLEGYGRVTLDDVLYFDGDSTRLLVVDSWAGVMETQPFTATGQSKNFLVNVNSPDQSLKVTLVWTDPPAALSASPAQVNDLNLIVTSPSGIRYFHGQDGSLRTLPPADPGSSSRETLTTENVDAVNVEEQVLLTPPVATGTWTVSVQAARIATSPQHFAVVINGNVNWRDPQLTVPVLSGVAVIVLMVLVTLVMIISAKRKTALVRNE